MAFQYNTACILPRPDNASERRGRMRALHARHRPRATVHQAVPYNEKTALESIGLTLNAVTIGVLVYALTVIACFFL